MTEKINPECQAHFEQLDKSGNELRICVAELNTTLKNFTTSVDRVMVGNGKEPLIVRLDRLEQFEQEQKKFKEELRSALISNIAKVVITAIVSLLVVCGSAILTTYITKYDKNDIKMVVKEVLDEKDSSTVASKP